MIFMLTIFKIEITSENFNSGTYFPCKHGWSSQVNPDWKSIRIYVNTPLIYHKHL